MALNGSDSVHLCATIDPVHQCKCVVQSNMLHISPTFGKYIGDMLMRQRLFKTYITEHEFVTCCLLHACVIMPLSFRYHCSPSLNTWRMLWTYIPGIQGWDFKFHYFIKWEKLTEIQIHLLTNVPLEFMSQWKLILITADLRAIPYIEVKWFTSMLYINLFIPLPNHMHAK